MRKKPKNRDLVAPTCVFFLSSFLLTLLAAYLSTVDDLWAFPTTLWTSAAAWGLFSVEAIAVAGWVVGIVEDDEG